MDCHAIEDPATSIRNWLQIRSFRVDCVGGLPRLPLAIETAHELLPRNLQLQEMAVHIRSVIDDIRAGRYDEEGDLSYEVALGHLMDHLALAWHESQMTDEEISELSQDQYERLCNAILRLQIENRLVKPYEKVV